jgi:signal transduction histidine kinase
MTDRGADSGNDKVSILLVDDQPARLLSYESILRDLGQNLVSVRSGREALERLMSDDYAVVLLDVNMPDMDGFEIAKLIHEHPRFERIPIIFVTGVHVGELDRLRGYELGAVDYVSIPIVPAILRSKVQVLVELYCQRRELRRLNASLTEANQRLAQAHSALQAEKTRELEELNATLREANRHKDEFLAMLGHELRNPLASINNAVQLMRNPQLPASQFSWVRDMIERQVRYLIRLIDDLLDVARITSGKINLVREAVPLATVISGAVETVQPLLSKQGHELTVEVSREPLFIYGDSTRLIQIVGNILGNAVKYTKSGGRIEVSAGLVDERIEIRVRDNGIGIEPALIPKIFDLFAQGDRSERSEDAGLGIGLALVKRLVDLHGGEIEARSEGANLGSEFIVRFPYAVQAVAEPQPCGEHALSGSLGSTKRRVLIADDNRDALDSLARLLQLSGHEVHAAADGLQALEAAARLRPDLMLLDIGMPGLNGYEVARRIRSLDWGRSAVLVALTGWGQDNDRRQSREAGFDSHWVKPLDSLKLAALLQSLPPAAIDGLSAPAEAAVPGSEPERACADGAREPALPEAVAVFGAALLRGRSL